LPDITSNDSVQVVATPSGPARVHRSPDADGGLLVLGHGAGGGVETPDLLAVRAAAATAGWTVARVEQPYRVAGRRAPAPAGHLDAAGEIALRLGHQPHSRPGDDGESGLLEQTVGRGTEATRVGVPGTVAGHRAHTGAQQTPVGQDDLQAAQPGGVEIFVEAA